LIYEAHRLNAQEEGNMEMIEIGNEVLVRHYHGNGTSTAVVIDFKLDYNKIQRGLLAEIKFADDLTELYPVSRLTKISA
jgi:hypothetical protein